MLMIHLTSYLVLFHTIETPDGDTDTASIIENFLEQQSDRRWEQGYSFNEYAEALKYFRQVMREADD